MEVTEIAFGEQPASSSTWHPRASRSLRTWMRTDVRAIRSVLRRRPVSVRIRIQVFPGPTRRPSPAHPLSNTTLVSRATNRQTHDGRDSEGGHETLVRAVGLADRSHGRACRVPHERLHGRAGSGQRDPAVDASGLGLGRVEHRRAVSSASTSPSPTAAPLIWTKASLEEDWPAPVRTEPAGPATIVPIFSRHGRGYPDPDGRHRVRRRSRGSTSTGLIRSQQSVGGLVPGAAGGGSDRTVDRVRARRG